MGKTTTTDREEWGETAELEEIAVTEHSELDELARNVTR